MHYCHLHAFDLYRDYNLNITQWLHNVFSRYIFVISFKCSSIRFGGYFRGGGLYCMRVLEHEHMYFYGNRVKVRVVKIYV